MTPYARIGGVDVFQLGDSTIHYCAGHKVDADGSPHAAHPDGRSGLDSLANVRGALVRGPDGKPVIQDPRDRAPGYYLVGTALVSSAVRSDLVADRYVNSELVGRVAYLLDGWVGVADEDGRIDEYRPARLYRH